jgi:hypothetical protein
MNKKQELESEKVMAVHWKCPTCNTQFVSGLGCSKCPNCGHGCDGMEIIDFLNEPHLLELKPRITLVKGRMIIE